MSFAYRLCRRLRYNIQIYLENPGVREYGFPHRRKSIRAKDVAKKYPDRLLLLLDEIPVPLEKQIEFSWNPNDCSSNLIVKEDKLTVYRSHIMNCTDAIRGKIAVSEGMHVWEVYWPIWKRGTNATIGVGTSSTPLHFDEYVNLIGHTADSWGWDLIHCKALHDTTNNNPGHTYPMFDESKEMYRIPSTFFMVLDMDAGTLAFVAEGEYLGVAFEGLQGQSLYPVIGCVWGSCEITLKYIGGLKQQMASLKELCRRFMRQTIKQDKLETSVNELGIPKELETYVSYKNPHSAYNTRVLKPCVEDINLDSL